MHCTLCLRRSSSSGTWAHSSSPGCSSGGSRTRWGASTPAQYRLMKTSEHLYSLSPFMSSLLFLAGCSLATSLIAASLGSLANEAGARCETVPGTGGVVCTAGSTAVLGAGRGLTGGAAHLADAADCTASMGGATDLGGTAGLGGTGGLGGAAGLVGTAAGWGLGGPSVWTAGAAVAGGMAGEVESVRGGEAAEWRLGGATGVVG
mmetsp:Transcript_14848/g.24774  ORF Transcript_14848/g.24774 Transcript_14848/m.24774 type:complete len:205 (+) Transcript_14848:507-1121(+)